MNSELFNKKNKIINKKFQKLKVQKFKNQESPLLYIWSKIRELPKKKATKTTKTKSCIPQHSSVPEKQKKTKR